MWDFLSVHLVKNVVKLSNQFLLHHHHHHNKDPAQVNNKTIVDLKGQLKIFIADSYYVNAVSRKSYLPLNHQPCQETLVPNACLNNLKHRRQE
jgi:hypothetical protein